MADSWHPRPQKLKTQLMEWGYTKNVKRAEVQHILRESQSRESAGKQSSFTLRQRPVALDKVTKHGHRARLSTQPAGTAPPFPAFDDTVSGSRQIACRTPPPAQIPAALPPNQRWVVSEKILFHVDALVKGSFEAGRWRFNGNDALIHSSLTQQAELNRLHGFLNSLIDGSAAAAASDFVRAGSHWRHAFLAVEDLVVQGAYHNIVPNLVLKINDLNRQGLGEVAAMLKTHIARCCGKAEILSERGGFEDQVEAEAAAIVERAMALQGENDGWQRLYNFVRGWFFLGQAQFRMGKREDALVSLLTALGVAEEFRMIDESDIFEPERAVIVGYLETLQLAEPLVNFLGTAHDGKAAGAH